MLLLVTKTPRATHLDAKIDFEEARVVVDLRPTSIHRQVMEKTKEITSRCFPIMQSMERRSESSSKPGDKPPGGFRSGRFPYSSGPQPGFKSGSKPGRFPPKGSE
jgi:hypothetical protein